MTTLENIYLFPSPSSSNDAQIFYFLGWCDLLVILEYVYCHFKLLLYVRIDYELVFTREINNVINEGFISLQVILTFDLSQYYDVIRKLYYSRTFVIELQLICDYDW